MPIFALIDCNSFYASCEKVFRPELRDEPVIVLSNNDGCIVSLSKEAKELGLKRGAPFFKAKKIVRENNVYVFSSNYALYGDISQRVMETLEQFTPDIEVYSIDEAFISLDGIHRTSPEDYCRKIKNTIGKWVGIPVSIGIAQTKTLAKVANRIAKKNPEHDGVLDITDRPDIDGLLSRIDVSDVWGIGRQYSGFLHKSGIHTARDLKNTDANWARKNMTVVGERTVLELRGIMCMTLDEMPQPKKAILSSRSFGNPVETLDELDEAVSTYAAIASAKLRKQSSSASFVEVFITTNPYSDEPQYANSATTTLASPTADTSELIGCARTLLRRLFKTGYRYKKAGVLLAGIVPDDSEQQSLFSESYGKSKRESLMSIIDSVNGKLGKEMLKSASTGIDRPWGMRQSFKSQNYTTHWAEIPTARI